MERNKTLDSRMKYFIDKHEKRAKQAFEVLSHPDKRLIYDTFGETILKTCGKVCTSIHDYYHGMWHQSLAFYVQLIAMGIAESFLLKRRTSVVRYSYWIIWLFVCCMTFEWYLMVSSTLAEGTFIQAFFRRKSTPEKIWAWRQCVSKMFLYMYFLLPTDHEYKLKDIEIEEEDDSHSSDERFQSLLQQLKNAQDVMIKHLSSIFHSLFRPFVEDLKSRRVLKESMGDFLYEEHALKHYRAETTIETRSTSDSESVA
jgi:hypothetical protein